MMEISIATIRNSIRINEIKEDAAGVRHFSIVDPERRIGTSRFNQPFLMSSGTGTDQSNQRLSSGHFETAKT
jgi:hypothetical protein